MKKIDTLIKDMEDNTGTQWMDPLSLKMGDRIGKAAFQDSKHHRNHGLSFVFFYWCPENFGTR